MRRVTSHFISRYVFDKLFRHVLEDVFSCRHDIATCYFEMLFHIFFRDGISSFRHVIATSYFDKVFRPNIARCYFEMLF